MRVLKTGVTVHDTARVTQGFTLFSPLAGKNTYLIDLEGKVVHQWDLPGQPGAYARLLPNGNLFYACAHGREGGPPFPGGAQGGWLREVDWDGKLVHEHLDLFQHHDARKLANGNMVYPVWERMPDDAAKRVQGGVTGSEHTDGSMWSDAIVEVSPDGKIVWEWHAHSDLEIENYPIHPLLPRRVYTWCNTVVPLANGDVMVSFRHENLVAIIDRKTKRFSWEKRDDEWGHQHDCQMLENGNILLFANGMNTTAVHPHSRVVEIDPETKDEVWSFKANPAMHFYSHHISGAERLASGNTLICEGSWGRIFEVTPSREIVWEFINPYFARNFAGEDVNWVFRAFRYAADSPEIRGRV